MVLLYPLNYGLVDSYRIEEVSTYGRVDMVGSIEGRTYMKGKGR